MTWHYTGFQRFTDVWEGKPGVLMPALHKFSVYGWIGVPFFFIISGFVICMSAWGRSPGEFMVSRVTRLFPAYWLAVFMTGTLLILARPTWVDKVKSLSYTDILTNLTMMQDGIAGRDIDGVYWTLYIELRFYVLFGLMMALGALTYRKAVAFCGLWLFFSAIASNADIPLLQIMLFPQWAPYFIAGMAMYLIYRFGSNLLLWCIIAFAWLLAQHQLQPVLRNYSADAQEKLSFTVTLALITLAFGAMIAVAMGWLDRIQWKWLTVAGALTYPVYLVHQEIGWWVIHELHAQVNAYVLVVSLIAAMLVLAYLIHRLVERPVSKRLKRGLDSALRDIRAGGGRQRHQPSGAGSGAHAESVSEERAATAELQP
ncbi:peptidoglycan/LPS O-acetylase OafA/YrhL [Streptomyces sp. TLI_171]|nr:peptidoglycan/LPS O-acetylase OafA/YrhL [Streptomyces sp. TLI_171]